ncbi:hypothetical protein BDD21_1570 [Thiocapsa rosea]|uniref:Uncharacterized protein n=1 Tax=Thiocapsa rosea TaxID=69360 RepID=A0A495V6E8_9GAMM|nr:hypothetical protein BDD21_1570 [Thiocapsa rosea]
MANRETDQDLFFGLGAVGSALLICLSERDDVPVRFVVDAVNPDAARGTSET